MRCFDFLFLSPLTLFSAQVETGGIPHQLQKMQNIVEMMQKSMTEADIRHTQKIGAVLQELHEQQEQPKQEKKKRQLQSDREEKELSDSDESGSRRVFHKKHNKPKVSFVVLLCPSSY